MHCDSLSDFPPANPRPLADSMPPTIYRPRNVVQSVPGVVACPTPAEGNGWQNTISIERPKLCCSETQVNFIPRHV
jgi:hypothetical protein